MLSDVRVRTLVDYPDASEVFPGVSIEGGVSYFLWDANHAGAATTSTFRAGITSPTLTRKLNEFDVLVREGEALPILRKVLEAKTASFANLVSPQKPFGLLSNFSGFSKTKVGANDFRFYGVTKGKRVEAWVKRTHVTMNEELAKDPKVLLPEARGKTPDGVADLVLGKPWVVPGNSVCTQTFMFVPVRNEAQARSIESYIATKFVRFLVSLRKISQHTKADTYLWVPQQTWDRTWTDADLNKKYKLTKEEIAFIERMVRPMNLNVEGDNE